MIKLNKKFAVATKAALYKNGKYLVLHLGDGRMDLPGGKIEWGEDLEEGLLREIYEETGLTVLPKSIIHAWGFIDTKDKERHLVIIGYYCQFMKGKEKLSDEHTHFHWATAKKVLRDKIYPDWIKQAIGKAEKARKRF